MANPVHPIVGPEDYLSPYPDIDYSMGPKTIYGDVDVFTVILNDAPADQDDEWGRTEEICLRMFTDEIIAIHQALFGYSGILGLQQECNALFGVFVGFGPNFDHPELSILTLGATGATTLQDGQLALGVGTFFSYDTLSLNGGTFSITIDPVSLLTTLSSSFSNTASVLLDLTTPSVTLEIFDGVNTTDYIFTTTAFAIPHGVSFTATSIDVNGDVSCSSLTLSPSGLTTLVDGLLTIGATTLADGLLTMTNTILADQQLTINNGNILGPLSLTLGTSSPTDVDMFSISVDVAHHLRTFISAANTTTQQNFVGIILDPEDPSNPPGPVITLNVNGLDYVFSGSFFTINSTSLSENALNFGPLGSAINFGPDSAINFGTNGVISLAGGGSIAINGIFSADGTGVWSGDYASPIKWVRMDWPTTVVWPTIAGGHFDYPSIDTVNPLVPDPSKCVAVIVSVVDYSSNNCVFSENLARFQSQYFTYGGHYKMHITVPANASPPGLYGDIGDGDTVLIRMLFFYTN